MDASGTISREELRAALMTSGLAVPDHEADDIFDRLDIDHSGGIDPKEFDAAFFAARLASGVDVYIPVRKGGKQKGLRTELEIIEYLESEVFRNKLLRIELAVK